MKHKDKDKRQKREKDIHGCKRRYFFKETERKRER